MFEKLKINKAFTMAEILLSLMIIGVIAAITLPSLIGNINERVWNTQRKVLYARMSQAISMLPQINGYGVFVTSNDGTIIQDTATQVFITDGLSKVLKINNVCDNSHLADCGIASSYTDLASSKRTMPNTLFTFNSEFSTEKSGINDVVTKYNYNTKAGAFETQNGESIIVLYNPYCKSDSNFLNIDQVTVFDTIHQYMCANFIFDLNGLKGPNQYGKDIGVMSAIFSNDSEVVGVSLLNDVERAGYAYGLGGESYDFSTSTHNVSKFKFNTFCQSLGVGVGLPNIKELMSIYYNAKFSGGFADTGQFWSSTTKTSNCQVYITNYRYSFACNGYRPIRCVKRFAY